MRCQKDLKTMKNRVNKIKNQRENWYNFLQNGKMTKLWEKSRLTLGQIIAGTKCDRDKPIFSAERGEQ